MKTMRLAIVALVVCSTGCDGAGSPPDEERTPLLSAEEDLRVGSVDDGEYALTWFRAMEVSESGRIYTLHPQEQVIRMFDTEGTFLGTIGGRGDGPGEFQNAGAMGWVADTLWVLDFNGYRFIQFTEDGELLGDFTVPFVMGDDPTTASPPRASGLLRDGTVHGAPVAWSHLVASGDITHHEPMLMDRDGTVTDTLPAIPFGNNTWAVSDPDNPQSGGSYGPQPFGDGPLWSFVPGERAMIRLDRDAPEVPEEASFTLTKLSFEGDTLLSRGYPFAPVPVRQEEVDSVLEARARPLGERGFLGLTVARAREWAGQTLYRPAFRPHVSSMTVGRDGTIWLATTARADSTSWMVLDSAGAPLGEVVLPRDFTMLEAERDRVWGSVTDELDVPYLVRYRVGEQVERQER